VLVVAPGPISAANPALASHLKALRLITYPARTTPPHFSGSGVDGRPVSMAAFRGKVILVNFWASWCPECRPEMPAMERLHRELASRGLAVVAVNARERREVVARHAQELGLTFPVVLDPDGEIGALYGVVGLPATFLVGRDGRAVAFAVGSREWGGAPARALLEILLAEPAEPSGRE
jgi:thiol-disulfide isomerase/thioredoxin